jgi:opacity protein-like surface antigen
MSLRKWFVTASLVVAATAAVPAKASADWLFTPFMGATFGGSANFGGAGQDFKSDFSRNLTYGASLEWMGGGVFGFGFDVGYSPNFFRPSDNDSFSLVGDGNVTTAMANVIVGAPLGAIRPYLSGGVGVIKQKVDNVGQFFDSIDSSNLGFNAGAGVMGFFSHNVGIRGDIRFFRSVHDSDPNGVNLDLGQFKFWRGTVGVTFKF